MEITKIVVYLVLIGILFILFVTYPLTSVLLFIVIIAISLYQISQKKEIKNKPDSTNIPGSTFCQECESKVQGKFCQECGTEVDPITQKG